MTKLHFDPKILPIESLAGEAAVLAEELSVERLRRRFASPPHWTPETIEERLLRVRDGNPTRASVLMPLVQREHGLSLLLTERTAHLTDHPGQVSLPGGRTEPEDQTAIDTALRETEEEIGLARRHIEVLGMLPDHFTGTGYRVTPVVGLVHPPFELTADPFEVEEIFEVPLAFLMDGMNHQRRSIEAPGMPRRTFYTMPYDRFFIWGATAAMLRNLFHFLRAR